MILRKSSGAGLAEAKDAIEQPEKQLRETEPAKFTASVGRTGCLGVVALFFFGIGGLLALLKILK